MSEKPIVLGRYALRGELARGGMATVHLGRLMGPAGFARTVAIKRLHPHLASDPAFVTMLLDEARLAARVQHPNVAATLDVVAKDGELFVVMEYLHGESLSQLLRTAHDRDERVPIPVASAILIGTLTGLHAAHEARGDGGEPLGLVHRDVSPHNIMVRREGTAVVVDFGIAKAAGRFHTTEEGKVKGKLPYMAPEQVRGQALSRSVDIYAAAAVLWETLTGARLIVGSNEGEVLEKLLFSTLSPPSTMVNGIPPALDEVVMKGLARDPAERWKTAREMALALEEAMPPATALRTAAWLEALAGDALTLREARLSAIESEREDLPASLTAILGELKPSKASDDTSAGGSKGATNIASSVSAELATMPDSIETISQVRVPPAVASKPAPFESNARDRSPRLAANARILGTVALVVVMAVVLLSRTRAPSRSSSDRTTATALDSASAPALASDNAARGEPAPSIASGAPPLAASTMASASASPARSSTPDVHIPTRGKPLSIPHKDPCVPPYYLDANGKRIYKRECL
jgi:serine/threonine-protein kinase